MPRLTKQFVDCVQPPSDTSDRTFWDDTLSGFGVRVRASGAKTWVIMYRTQDGRLRKYRIGQVGALTPDEARKEARQKLAAVDRGADPAEEKGALRKAITVAELCELFLADEKSRIKPTTYKTDESRVACHVIPLLGTRRVISLLSHDIEQLQADIAAGKSRQPRRKEGRGDHATGGRGVAARTVSMVGTMLEFARRRGIVETNVARGVQKFSIPKRTRFLSHEEYAALGKAIEGAADFGESKVALAAIKALALTGCRRQEILGLRRDWLDSRTHCIRFGDTKTGPQLRPLGNAAIDLLSMQPCLEDSPWVFPAIRGDGQFIGAPRVFARLCSAAGLREVTLHTLRHSFATTAVELGFSELVISGLLGHRGNSVTARYAHVPDRALLAAADAVSQAIESALAGRTADILNISDAVTARARGTPQ
jgi:integrase